MTYRVKGTPPGYDVGSAADYLLSFNSSWPLLKVHETGTFSADKTHNLGYPPFYIVTRTDGRVDQFVGLLNNSGVDSSTLSYGSISGTRRYFIFRLDLTVNFTAPVIETSTTSVPSNNDYVFKMTKADKDISSSDLRDFSLHSGAKSPMVHKVVEQAIPAGPDGWNLSVSHGLGYTPIAFVYIKPSTNTGGYTTTKYIFIPPPVGVQDALYTANSSTIDIVAFGDVFTAQPRVSVVILKDPFLKEQVNVSFP
jgi:hypothetical protein